MVRTFTGGRPPRNEMDEQEDAQVSEPGLNDFRPMPRNLFVGGAEQDHLSETDDKRTLTGYATQPEQFQVPTGTRQRPSRPHNSQHERPERSAEPARTTELEERTRVLEMAMGKILARLSPDDPLIPLLNKDAQPAARSIDELKSPRSHQQTLDLDNAPLNLSITAEPYQEGFKIPHLETYDGSGDPDEHLHTYQAIMRIQNANDAMMCKVFPATLKSTARRWEIKRTAIELMQVHQKEGESLRDYMQRFNKVTLDIDNVPDTICLSALLHGLKRGRFLDDLLENPPKTWNEVNDRSQILAQIQHWVRRPSPPLYESPRADKSKHCDYHRTYGHNTEDCQHLKDELEFLARNGKFEGYVQKPHAQQPTQTHFVQGYDRPQGQRYQLGGGQDVYQDNQYPSEQGRAYKGRQFNRRGQGQRAAAQNQKDRKGVGYAGIPPPSGTINMISSGVHSGGQSARGRKAYARQVMTVNKNRPLKRPFEEAEWENAPITFSPVDYERTKGEPDVMMLHAYPFVATVHIGNHNVNKVFIDTSSSPDILYWSCFQKMQLNPSSLQKHEGPIYGFDNQPVLVEGIITLPIYVGSEPRFMMASVTFLVVKMESAFNAILGRATLCKLKAVISQPHLCMKFPTPQGVGVLKGNQKMARACYQDTFKKIGTKLTEKERAELLEFLRINQDVFAWTTDEMLGIPAELTVHKLSTDPTRRPVAGFIRRVEYSEWVSNPVLVKKPNGKWRMCIDFTNLNDACPKDPHPLPNVEKLVERAAGHEWMSFLDASSGYHQVQLLLDDQEKTAFYAGDAIYCYVMMSFGLKNAGATYQKLVQIVFKLQIGRNIEVYVNDMIVTSLNPLKCTFAVESGKFLGYVVSKKGIEVNLEKVQAVRQMEPPKTVKDVQRLTGRVAALHRFIARSAEKCLHFFKALREPKNFPWTAECQKAFDELKQYLASAPLLSKPVEGESLYMYLGVTEEAVSSVLLREENKNQKPICYVSKVLQGAEQKYPLVEKAFFALVCAARKLRAYFQSHQIVVYTDFPLRKILQKPKLSGRLIGWSVELSEYDLKFQPRTTIKGQVVADFLVECISTTVKEKTPEHPVWVLYVDRAANVEGSGAGAVLLGPDGFKSEHALRFKFQTTNNAAEYEALIYGLKLASELKVQSIQIFNDSQLVVCQLYKRAASMPLLCCLTPYEAEYAVREVHEGVCGMHIGGKTLARKLLRHGYYWPIMVEDAQNYVKKCPTCQFNADDIHMLGKMLSSLTSPWPFAQWGVDLLGPFIKGKGGFTFLVVAVDYFTKWIEAKPFSTTIERKIKEFLFNSILCRFGIPKRIIADNGPQFRAAALRSFCNDYGIELALTSVYTPQSNGQAESANKIVLRGLKTRVLAAHSNWVDELNKVLWSCRTTPSSATGETPFSLAYGAEAVIPVEVGLPSDRAGWHDDLNNEQLLRENLDFVEEFQVGDLVLRKAGLTNAYLHMGKLAPNWEGPYMVISIQRPRSYRLADLQGHPLPFIWNIHNLRKFYS
ncbi:hypothetical protein SLEP1_g28653 [Rubroshorea leprosula]|uniref:Integrase catalytic domain-containing protein n=1 Tax=Rubroshorea leprosula TaxID=152421 RepID=A0AAV5K016_9ROSI|nr:hypothetical protein SLEP1_g28653 [Rubroshorea leprosula]